MSLCITGGAGFVGSSLARHYREHYPERRIVAFDNLKRRGSELNLAAFKALNIEFTHGDVRIAGDLAALEGEFDLLIDASAEPSAHAGANGAPDYLIATNLGGTLNCLEWARQRAGALLFLSTSRVYALPALRALPLREEETRLSIDTDQPLPVGLSAAGIGDVLGSDAPRIADLEPNLRVKLDRIAERHAPPPVEGEVRFALIGDLERCDEKTLEVSSLITSAPDQSDRESCGLMAFVATKSIERCPTVRVICNCGAAVDYRTRDASNVATCGGCGTLIGLLGVSGDGECVEIIRPDGSPGTAPILGRHRFAVSGVAIDR